VVSGLEEPADDDDEMSLKKKLIEKAEREIEEEAYMTNIIRPDGSITSETYPTAAINHEKPDRSESLDDSKSESSIASLRSPEDQDKLDRILKSE